MPIDTRTQAHGDEIVSYSRFILFDPALSLIAPNRTCALKAGTIIWGVLYQAGSEAGYQCSGLFRFYQYSGLFWFYQCSGLFRFYQCSGLFRFYQYSGLFQFYQCSGLFRLTSSHGFVLRTDNSCAMPCVKGLRLKKVNCGGTTGI